MRRKDREVTALNEIREILDCCKVAHLGMIDDGMPYVIPMNYGYFLNETGLIFYFHTALEGHKFEILEKNPFVCVEVSDPGDFEIHSDNFCRSTSNGFCSVIGSGKAELVSSTEEKCMALSLLMGHYGAENAVFTKEQADKVAVLKVVCDSFTGKKKR